VDRLDIGFATMGRGSRGAQRRVATPRVARWLEPELRDHVVHGLGVAHHIEVERRDTLLQKLTSLLHGPLDADALNLFLRVRRFEFVAELAGELAVERPRNADEVFLAGQYFEAGNDRHFDACRAARIDVREVVLILEKHLRDDVLGAGVHFCLRVTDVCGKVGRLEVLLRVAGAAHAELHGRRVEVGVEEVALVHGGDLRDEITGVAVSCFAVPQWLLVALVVAANGQDVIDAKVAKLDEEVLRLLLGKPLAKNVRYGVDVVLVLDQRAHAKGAGALTFDRPLNAVRRLFVDNFGRMARDVDERRTMLHQVVDKLH
jgi:hypothetical protein